jgi:uncharacterized RDD family membrane protein YckC
MVNGDKVVSEQPLRDGDLIAIGAARLLFQTEPLDSDAGGGLSPLVAAKADDGQKGETRCSSCGHTTEADDKFCRKCGKPVTAASTPRQAVCGHCSTAVALPAEFCGNCGKPLLAEKSKHHVPTQPPHWEPPLADKPLDKPQVPSTPPAAKAGRPPGRPGREAAAIDRTPGRRPRVSKDVPAGFWIRFAAFFIDSVIINVPMILTSVLTIPAMFEGTSGVETAPSALVFILPFVGGGLTLLLAVVYPVYFWSTSGSTPGKSLFGLKVTAQSGACPIGAGQALMRVVGYFINGFTFGIGFLLVAFSDDNRGLHDRLAETKVVRRR